MGSNCLLILNVPIGRLIFIKYLEAGCDKNNPGSEYLLICLDELKAQRKRILELTRSLRRYMRESKGKASDIISFLIRIPGLVL